MTAFNSYTMYSANVQAKPINTEDKVDKYIDELRTMSEYDDVKSFVETNFGDVNGEKLYDYPELKKQIYILVDDDKIEFCAAKNKQQYFGKGWKLISESKSERAGQGSFGLVCEVYRKFVKNVLN